MLALELVEQLFTVSASQAINYGDCRQAVTSTGPRQRRPSQAQSWFPKETCRRALPECRLRPTDEEQAVASSWGQALRSNKGQLNTDLKSLNYTKVFSCSEKSEMYYFFPPGVSVNLYTVPSLARLGITTPPLEIYEEATSAY